MLAEITIERNGTFGPGFLARFYDRVSERHYSGTGESALEAVAWMFDDFIARTMLGMPHSIARRADAKPGDRLAAAAEGRPADTVLARGGLRAAAAAATHDEHPTQSAGCFDTNIPRAAEPMLLTDIPKKSAAARRSSVKKAKKT